MRDSMTKPEQTERSHSKKWPTFIIIGAPKAGTTSAYFYLQQHPEVFMSAVKEPHYFSTEPDGDKQPRIHGGTANETDYLALFESATTEKARGEASTGYLVSPEAAQRIASDIPDVKIIAILRNPADRAFSGYMMKARNGREFSNISDAFQRGKAFVENSFYHTNLLRYFELFPKENISVYVFEEFSRNPVGTMQDIYRFIGVDDSFEPATPQHNQAWFPRYPMINALRTQVLKSRTLRKLLKGSIAQKTFRKLTRGKPPEFPTELREQLLALYREDIEATQALLSRDLSFWLGNSSKTTQAR